MTRLLLALSVVLVLGVQQADEQYPGQSEHKAPPAGWYCEHQDVKLSVPATRICSCERHCDENGNIVEDRACSGWCYPPACHCGMSMGAAASCK